MFNPPDKKKSHFRGFPGFCFKLLFALLLLLAAREIGLGGTVFAISNPTSISIVDVTAYDAVLEADDLLVVVEYELNYAVIPAEIISDAYLGRFLNGTTELTSVEPYAFNDNGYGSGIFSFYWSPAQKETASIEFNNPNAEPYRVVLQGKPGVFPGTAPSITTPTIDWQDVSNTSNLLYAQVSDLAYKFENIPAWNDDIAIDLIQSPGGVLQLTAAGSGSGEEYFSNTIRELQSMIPAIFSSGTSAPDFSESPVNQSYEENLNTFWDNNWVGTHFDTLATTYDAPRGVITALIATIFIGLISFFCANLLGQNAESAGFGMLSMAVTLPMFTAINMVPLNFTIVTVFILGVLGIGWVIFLRRAGA
tara:strand:- start:151 stop:1242 length:1092 start_codon:yes stop_codon:yes gene_type:complete